jgi:pyrroloquinoline quinone biosynthesis protein B
MAKLLYSLIFICFTHSVVAQKPEQPYVLILGVAQDGGYPHTGCKRPCCAMAWAKESMRRYVVSIAVVDPEKHEWYLFEATPDIKQQLHYFQELTKGQFDFLPNGVFVTHAHIGHYTGLMDFGREVMGTNGLPVYVMPKMKTFLETNGPWSQLVSLHNIAIQPMFADSIVHLSANISVRPFTVPHRDEFSETAGFEIITSAKKYLFIPDVNKWDKWDRSIIDEVSKVDVAMVDATFFDNTELPAKNFTVVPHPFVSETMKLFANQASDLKTKIHFIHFNHTNPLLWDKKKQAELEKAGFNFAKQGEKL